MKKLVLSFLFFLFAMSLLAQNEGGNKYKPSKNNFSVEVDFIPFSNSPINLNAFRGRFFLTEKMALRVGFNFKNKKLYSETPVNFQNDNVLMFNTSDEKFSVYGLSSGLEYHLLHAKRISPYIGFDLGYEVKSANAAYENVVEHYDYPDYTYEIVKTEYTNAWEDYEILYNSNGYYYVLINSERAYTKFSANVVIGADVYIIKHLYMGFELGLGYNSLKYKEVEVKVDGVIKEKYPVSTDSGFGLNVNNAIRLGVWF